MYQVSYIYLISGILIINTLKFKQVAKTDSMYNAKRYKFAVKYYKATTTKIKWTQELSGYSNIQQIEKNRTWDLKKYKQGASKMVIVVNHNQARRRHSWVLSEQVGKIVEVSQSNTHLCTSFRFISCPWGIVFSVACLYLHNL